ncbi:M1 family metallopeptidase [Candidatus Synechococcus calcipolaris G9]|uniref:Aminopeptidase N n=1 Tax=Candidatus Synechococcus calcipolaris G9 TaxID=1497997 RepID=A0ABT6F317_9SYNE|nr:M1 family metallopeptidase [Candidatus Synechococcus calcipolaris]MDG2992176.1 M1 family metallopeptidase [Candidatus Synechococcus calcipolaris G9]
MTGFDTETTNAFALAGSRPHYSPDRPGQVEHIFLDLSLDLEQQRCWGQCHIRLRPIRTDLTHLELDAVNQTIHNVKVNDQAQKFDYDGAVLIVHLDPGLGINLHDLLTVSVDYSLEHPQRGLYFIAPDHDYPHKSRQAWTQGEDEDSRYWFPCFDYPGQLATSEVRVRVAHPYLAISNGELRYVTEEGSDKIYHWYQPQVHPSYLITLAVGDFAQLEDHWQGKPVTYYVTKGREEDARRTMGKTPRMIEFFSDIFGYAYPYSKYAQVCVEDFIFGGMENTSTTLLTDRCLLDERAALDNRSSESLVAHELAHQWFGDLVVIKHWSHAWIKEGMASYAEVLWTAAEYGPNEAAYYRLNEARNYLHEDKSRYRRPIVTHVYRAAMELYDRHLYEKGACVYHMMRQELGDELFWRGIHTFLQTHAHKTVETVDLLRAMETATGRNLLPLFDQYVFRGGHPDYHVTYGWDKDGSLAVLTIKQKQAKEGTHWLEQGLFDLKLPIGFGYVADDGAVTLDQVTIRVQEAEQRFYFPLSRKPSFISFDVGNHTLKTVTLAYPLPELKSQLSHDPDPLSRLEAAKAIAKKGHLTAVQSLVEQLKTEAFWGVRLEIVKALATIKLDQALEGLALALGDGDARVRRAAVTAIADIKTYAAYKLLKPIAEKGDASYSVEAAALKGIGAIAGAQTGEKPKPTKVLKILQTALEKRSGWNEVVRCGAIAGLSALKDLPEAVELILAYTQLGTPQALRLAAVRALGTLGKGPSDYQDKIFQRLHHLADEPLFLTQVAVVNALGQMDSPKSLGLLQQLRERTLDHRVKRSADEAIPKVQKAMGSTQALKSLEETVAELKRENQTLKSRLEKLEVKSNVTPSENGSDTIKNGS